MRVQAKRLQRNGVLKVRHTVKSSGKEQRDLLIEEAEAEGMKPVYCIYCTEPQRTVWTQGQALPGFRSFQTGCLLAGAEDVPGTAARLEAIEEKCRPWHHLFAPEVLRQKELEAFSIDGGDFARFISIRQPRMPLVRVGEAIEPPGHSGWNAPTINDLNSNTGREFDWTGVRNTTRQDLEGLESGTEAESEVAQSDGERLRELGIRRMMVMDVRDDPEPGTLRGRRGR